MPGVRRPYNIVRFLGVVGMSLPLQFCLTLNYIKFKNLKTVARRHIVEASHDPCTGMITQWSHGDRAENERFSWSFWNKKIAQ